MLVLNIVWANPDPDDTAKLRAAKDWSFLILSAVLILAASVLSSQSDIAYMISLVCAQAAIKRGAWPAGLLYGLGNMLVWLIYLLWTRMPWPAIIAMETSLIIGLMMILLFITLVKRYSDQTSRAESLLKELQFANAALEAAHQAEKNLAIAEERVRLARDIHDGLGHHLTVLSIQLQAASKLVERNPQAASEAIQASRAEAQAALDEVRRSVSVMREAPGNNRPIPENLAALVESFGQHAGLQAYFELAGSPVLLSPFAQETLYRAAQEGLTNAQKHARDARCIHVRLVYAPESIRLSIQDDGVLPQPGETSSHPRGFGLQGLRQRVDQLGGEVRSGPGETGGFELKIIIPIEGKNDNPSFVGG